ncbi:YMGG-like glycine zipper-containing protein [Mucilaginibacter aquatilis]|uniref:YMGG-like Gly-zipper domain-containing protein n=1 Tax=Mucilaginibacter aquatilis TaxID=1517760 RepID=A0A6I4IHT1_9SPHI|nr:YMGG-like glycine zipper-containing protein [Mucilaginibacter aquatilis]MVN93066.1 hypothetical protein [Mucilaginibacter aquatilis]
MKKTLFLFSLILTIIISATNSSFAQKRKKGMSSQAKGAIIGGAGGAVAGGLIGGNAKGAIIGGAVGAGGGYIIGNESRRAKEKRARANRKAYRSKKNYHPGRL